MAYESPISVWWSDTRIEQLRDEYDNLIIKAVKNVCPQVDKDELIKALEYDRGQYEKGFADGIAYKPPVKSNYDRIRAMNDEKLAVWMANNVDCQYCSVRSEWCTESEAACKRNWLDWLRQEVSE